MARRNTRLGRQGFWIASALVWLVFLLVRLKLPTLPGVDLAWAALTLLACGLLMRSRLHDRDRSGWAMLALVVPVLGALWLFWELALRRGTPGPNRYGADPAPSLNR
jgi:uncharacterized membrane protein YhaH (DUF805 family)